MSKIVIADSSCLIALSKIGELKLLEGLFSHIFVPQAVYQEVVIRGEGRPGSKEVLSATWIKVQNINDRLAVDALRLQLGIGESEAIVLAIEMKADFIILDDWRARQAAVELKLPVIGTVAILTKAAEKGYLPDLAKTLESLKLVGFHFSIANKALIKN